MQKYERNWDEDARYTYRSIVEINKKQKDVKLYIVYFYRKFVLFAHLGHIFTRNEHLYVAFEIF